MSTKKEKLLETAEKLFYQFGFHAIGLKQIIKEADVALMTMYNHFQSKDELILEVLKRREQRYMAFLKKYVSNTDLNSPFDIVKGHADWLIENEQRGCLFLRAKEEFGGDPDHMVVKLADRHKQRLLHFTMDRVADMTEREALQVVLLCEGATALAETVGGKTAGDELLSLTERLS